MLVACGGGGSGGATAVAPTDGGGGNVNPLAGLADFMPTENSSSIRAVQNIVNPDGTHIDVSSLFETEGLNGTTVVCATTGVACTATFPGADFTLAFVKNDFADISLIFNNAFFSEGSYRSEITDGIPIEGIEDITFARGNLRGTRAGDDTPFEFETFSGWLDDSIFGTIQVKFGLSGSEQYRFASYGAGVPYETNPVAAEESETSATWAGATVASIKASREFIFGVATVTVNFEDTNIDLEFGNWHDLNNQELTDMETITYASTSFANGRFVTRSNNITEAFGHFYGEEGETVIGWFNTPDVTGAFEGTRQ